MTKTTGEDKLVDKWIDEMATTESALWLWVADVLEYLAHKYPQEMKETKEYAKQQRENAMNKWGSNKDKTFRQLGAIPSRLDIALKRLYGDEMPIKKSDFHIKFFLKYPEFSFAPVI